MNSLPLHPIVVHLPIALAVLIPLLSAGFLFAWSRNWLPRRAWIVAVALQALLVGSSVLAMRTGEQDEERVENVVAESAIETHEEAAEVFTWTAAGVLLLFVAGAAIPSPAAARSAGWIATAGTLIVLFLGYRVGEAGGTLVYRHGAGAAFATAAGASDQAGPASLAENEEQEDDD